MQLRYVDEPLDSQAGSDLTAAGSIGEADYDDGLLRTATPIMIAAYIAALGIAIFTFWQSRETLLSLAICAVYGTMFFGIPIVMARIRHTRDGRWSSRHPESKSDGSWCSVVPSGERKRCCRS